MSDTSENSCVCGRKHRAGPSIHPMKKSFCPSAGRKREERGSTPSAHQHIVLIAHSTSQHINSSMCSKVAEVLLPEKSGVARWARATEKKISSIFRHRGREPHRTTNIESPPRFHPEKAQFHTVWPTRVIGDYAALLSQSLVSVSPLLQGVCSNFFCSFPTPTDHTRAMCHYKTCRVVVSDFSAANKTNELTLPTSLRRSVRYPPR